MSTLTMTKEKDTQLRLGVKEKIGVLRGNRYFLLVFPFVSLAIIVLIFGIATTGRFFQPSVLTGIFSQAIIIGTCATGISFIYSNGNLDISIGAVLGLAATFGVMCFTVTGSVAAMISVCVVSAVLLMLLNCTMSVVFNIKTITVAIVVTQIYNAITHLLIGGAGKIDINFAISMALERGGFRHIAFVAYFIICLTVYHFTKIGRALRMLGGNEECAKQAGMSNGKATYISFLMAGLGVGVASVFSIINVSAVSLETGNGLGMDVMLATVLGGMSIFGGSRSNSYAGLIGALTVAALNKGLLMVGASSAMLQGIRGIIFLILVYLNSERHNLLPSRMQF